MFCGHSWLSAEGEASAHMQRGISMTHWFGILELPLLFLCQMYAFMTAKALRGGRLGHGMNLLAWGFLVMAVGHLHMQVDHFFGFNLFNFVLGDTLGFIAWIAALSTTWTLSWMGFYSIYKASKGD